MLDGAPTQSPADYLRAALMERIGRNPAYSLRAMARDLGLSHTYLSLVLNGRKAISARQAEWLGESLRLDPATTSAFVQSALAAQKRRPVRSGPRQPKPAEFLKLDLDKMRILRDWYHFAILDLTQLSNFVPSPAWIGRRLGITADQVKDAAERLERLGLLERSGKSWRKTSAFLDLPTNRSSAPMRRLHREMMLKAIAALQSPRPADFQARDITGSMIPINTQRIPAAKIKIARFRKQLMRFLSEGECDELYQLNVQLFRLTRPSEPENQEAIL